MYLWVLWVYFSVAFVCSSVSGFDAFDLQTVYSFFVGFCVGLICVSCGGYDLNSVECVW